MGGDYERMPARTCATMGTVVSLRLGGSAGDVDSAAVEVVKSVFRRWDEQFSLYREDSELSRIARGDIRLTEASQSLRTCYALALDWRERTQGVFTPHRADGVIDLSGVVKALAIAEAVWSSGGATILLLRIDRARVGERLILKSGRGWRPLAASAEQERGDGPPAEQEQAEDDGRDDRETKLNALTAGEAQQQATRYGGNPNADAGPDDTARVSPGTQQEPADNQAAEERPIGHAESRQTLAVAQSADRSESQHEGRVKNARRTDR
ncbi:hypothetical protein E3T27_11625 [Cryobacterium lyxosi]|uniref:Uncharacterized protein n=1 Tax=Cryobacterium lyxosi TaxID=1259228 RepID=A0A4R8ZGT4_9MICO|nr:hypothetical protein E3T27_11625 [Cryobacterium lyxosi]